MRDPGRETSDGSQPVGAYELGAERSLLGLVVRDVNEREMRVVGRAGDDLDLQGAPRPRTAKLAGHRAPLGGRHLVGAWRLATQAEHFAARLPENRVVGKPQ